MTDKQVGVRINVGVQGQQDLQSLNKGLESLGQDATEAGKATAAGAKGVEQLGQKAAEAGKAATVGSQGAQQLGATARQAGAEANQAAVGIGRMGTAAEQAETHLGGTRRGLQSISAQLADTQQQIGRLRDSLIAGFSFQQFVQAAAQMEQVQAGLTAVARDSAVAGEQMAFVRRMATAAGVDVADAGKAFLGLAAATKGTAVEGEPARQVFEAVTLAMAKAGKGSAETQNALLALSQMASKGTVQMEELRGQLGEALPGALQAAANGMGITTKDLIDMVENGRVAAEDLFPALAKGLNQLYGGAPAAQTLSQEITNIKNAFVEMSADLGQAGGLNALKVGAELAQMAIFLLGDSLLQTGQRIGVLAAAVATLDFSGVSDAFKQIEQDAQQRLLKAAAHNDTFRAALKLSGDQATLTALAVNASTDAYEKAAGAANQTGASFTQLGVAFSKARKEAEEQVSLADKEVQAVKARGEAAVAQAKLLNDEAAVRKAVSKAAADEAVAVEHLAATKEGELNLLKLELAERVKAIAAAGTVSDQRKKELEELQKLVAEKQVDVDKTTAQAATAREHAKAQSEAVLATRAQREAVEGLNNARRTEAQAVVTGLQAQKELARQSEEMARLLGDENKVREAHILQLEIEIKLVKARAEVARVEAEGSIAVANAKLAELKASGQLTPAKEAELNASIKLAQAKIAEAKAMGQSTAILEKQLEAMRNGAGAANGLSGAFDGLAGSSGALEYQLVNLNGKVVGVYKSMQEAKKAAEGLNSVFDPRNGRYDAEGFALNTAGQRVTASGQLKKPEMPGDWEFVSDAAYPESKAAYPWLVVAGVGYWRDKTASSGSAQSAAVTASTASSSVTTPTPQAQSTGRTITLQFGGDSTRFTVGSEAEAQSVEAFLRRIEQAAARSQGITP